MSKTFKIDDSQSGASPVCSRCVHFDVSAPLKHLCSAFPSGIPTEIWTGANDHRSPVRGDGGIRFELKQAKAA